MPDIIVEHDRVSLKEKPLEFCKMIYAEASKRQEQLAPINEDNRLFYEGIDPNLEALAADPKVIRSTKFFQEIAPAVETIAGHAVAALKEQPYPLTGTPRNRRPTSVEKDQAIWIAQEITEQMKECNYLTDKFYEHVLASEIQRSPAIVKIGWRYTNVTKPQINILQWFRSMFTQYRVSWRRESVGMPWVYYLWPEEALYEPYISDFYNDSSYMIHAQYMHYHDLIAFAKEQGYNVDKISRLRDEKELGTGTSSTEDQKAEHQQARGTPFDKGFRDGKYLVCENYIIDYDDANESYIRLIVTVANKEIIYDGRSRLRGLKWPFVVLTGSRIPGTLESLSSLDKTKSLGRFVNSLQNAYIDALTYHMFAILLKRSGATMKGEPRIAPSAVWEMDDISERSIRPLLPSPIQLPDVLSLLQTVTVKIWNVLNAQDIPQGLPSEPYEKATIAKLRTVGRSRRLSPTNERYGKAMIEVAKGFQALNQQFHPNAKDFVADVVFDVPSLTGISDPETTKQEAILLLSQAQQSPLYRNPIGLKKLRNLHERVLQAFNQLDVDNILPTLEELEATLAQNVAAQKAQLEKQAVLENMQLTERMAANEPTGM